MEAHAGRRERLGRFSDQDSRGGLLVPHYKRVKWAQQSVAVGRLQTAPDRGLPWQKLGGRRCAAYRIYRDAFPPPLREIRRGKDHNRDSRRYPVSPLYPTSQLFASTLTGAVKTLSQPTNIELGLDRIPPATPAVRAGYLAQWTLNCTDKWPWHWEDPDIAYAAHRIGFTALYPQVLWLTKPDSSGSVIDWAGTDAEVAKANAGGFQVLFDPYSVAVHYSNSSGQ